MDQQNLIKEKQHLNTVLSKVTEAKSSLTASIEQAGGENLQVLKEFREMPETDPHDVLLFMERLHEANLAFNFKDKFKQLEEFEYMAKEPYFARIDLLNNEDQTSRRVYIGKFGYTEDEPVITDWRTKIASVYYRYRYPQKNVVYDTPEGSQVRDLTLKRTFEIDKGELIKYYNNDIQLDENELIAEKIEQRTGGVLEDIVETIQEGQLDIIESDPRQVCIVQGSVGSGKSTVAIHKLSHIFFNYPNVITPQRSILVAKSQVLVSYLSTLFPKLGIFDINYKTIKDLVYNLIFREKLPIKVDFDAIGDLAFSVEAIDNVTKKIEAIHEQYEVKLDKIFEDGFEGFASYVYSREQPVYENILEVVTDLNEELTFQKEYLKENPNSLDAWLYSSNVKDLRSILKKLRQLGKDLEEEAFVKLVEELSLPVKYELTYAQALLYVFVYSEIIGFRNVGQYDYCVVDEGQDFSVLEYVVLDKFVRNGRFCILGDLNQSYLDEGLSSWEDIISVIKEARHANTFELTTNYRSTKPIIEFANKILSPYTQDYLPKSINRKGSEPVVKAFFSQEDLLSEFRSSITEDARELSKSIGVIAFNPDMFNKAKTIIEELSLPDDKFVVLDAKKSIHYIPKGVYLSQFQDCKGLEFAKVYVLDLNLEEIHSFKDAKKAFVAVTRAMNELSIYGLTEKA